MPKLTCKLVCSQRSTYEEKNWSGNISVTCVCIGAPMATLISICWKHTFHYEFFCFPNQYRPYQPHTLSLDKVPTNYVCVGVSKMQITTWKIQSGKARTNKPTGEEKSKQQRQKLRHILMARPWCEASENYVKEKRQKYCTLDGVFSSTCRYRWRLLMKHYEDTMKSKTIGAKHALSSGNESNEK